MKVLRAIKIRLRPTKEQEHLFWKSAGVARWAYNYYISEQERVYTEWKNGKCEKKKIKETEIRKYINNTLKKTTHTWLSEVGSNVMKQSIKDADEAYKRFLKGISNRPKYKSKHRSTPSFYVNYESLRRTQTGFRGEKIGFVKTTTPLPKLKENENYSNPRITYDGDNWYLSVGYEFEPTVHELSDASIGIDLEIKTLAVCSDGITFKNINKTKRVRQLKKKLRREQRRYSRMFQENVESYDKLRRPIYKKPLYQCKNLQKQAKKMRGLHRKLANIRNNYSHQITNQIVKTKPSRIVMEDLNVKGMMKNRHLSKAVSEQRFYEFIRQMRYKCEWNGIQFIQAHRSFLSSKMCSCCGNIKKDLKLSDRIYTCICGNVMDRDYNASINLANYKLV